MKWVVTLILFSINLFTGHWLIQGFRDPEVIGFVKEQDGTFIQPDTTILQISGWALLFFIHVAVLYILCKMVFSKRETWDSETF